MDVRLVDRDWGAELASLRLTEPKGLRIVCPFIKQDPLWRLVGDEIPRGTRVVTRFNLVDFSSGVSDVAALADILDAGGEVRGIKGLHSKVFIFGDSAAAVTSANLTHRGLYQNQEFGCVSDLGDFVAACQRYFDELWEDAVVASVSMLSEWEERVATFLRTGVPGGRRTGLPDFGAAIEGMSQPPTFPGSATPTPNAGLPWLAEATRGHVTFFGQGDDRAPWSQSVIEEIDGSGSHWACTYPKGKRPRQVYDGDVMYLARMVEKPDDYLIYGRAVGLRHVEGRDDASAADIAARWWKVDWPHYVRVHDAEFVSGVISNGVPLSRLVDELGANGFGPTQENAARGSGNTNPRLSLREQPAVRLSRQGLAWMNDAFDAALAEHGLVPTEDLAGLDWPTSSGAT